LRAVPSAQRMAGPQGARASHGEFAPQSSRGYESNCIVRLSYERAGEVKRDEPLLQRRGIGIMSPYFYTNDIGTPV
jgi:hypothetical protein